MAIKNKPKRDKKYRQKPVAQNPHSAFERALPMSDEDYEFHVKPYAECLCEMRKGSESIDRSAIALMIRGLLMAYSTAFYEFSYEKSENAQRKRCVVQPSDGDDRKTTGIALCACYDWLNRFESSGKRAWYAHEIKAIADGVECIKWTFSELPVGVLHKYDTAAMRAIRGTKEEPKQLMAYFTEVSGDAGIGKECLGCVHANRKSSDCEKNTVNVPTHDGKVRTFCFDHQAKDKP